MATTTARRRKATTARAPSAPRVSLYLRPPSRDKARARARASCASVPGTPPRKGELAWRGSSRAFRNQQSSSSARARALFSGALCQRAGVEFV